MSRHKIVAGLLATLLHQSVWAQPDATASLLEQGRYWQSQGDTRRAMAAWEKLLLADPNQPEALYGLGLAALREKRVSEARGFLDRLTRVDGNSVFVKRLQQDITLAGGNNASNLEQARMLAASGQVEDAVQAYDKALQGREPQGDVALEYYSFLGYTPKGLGRAIEGLQRLSRENPGNAQIQLALAKHLIRDEKRRLEGLRLLEKLAQRKDVGADAKDSWRAGLLWGGAPSAAERPLFDAYLKQYPDDAEVRAALNTPRARPAAAPAWRQDARLARGFEALKQSDLLAAESAFQEMLRAKPNDPDALGGMGLVRMQQGRATEAEDFLKRAAAAPNAGRNWSRALSSARYWSLIDQAESARKRGETAEARKLLEQAIRLDGSQASAFNAMGRVFSSAGDTANAEKTYRYVLARHKNDAEAIVGLADVLAQDGRAEEALRLIDSLPPEQAARAGNAARLRATVAASRARAVARDGDAAAAREVLERARAADPANPWLNYELARLMLREGKAGQAQRLVDDFERAHPDTPDALFASALLASERSEWGAAYDTMARIPASSITPEMAQFQRRLWVHEQAAQAARLAQAGNADLARQQLAGLDVGNDPELLAAVAQAYVDAGDPARANALMQPLLNGPRGNSPDVLLPYASVLLKQGDDARVADVLRQVQKQKLDPDQHRSFQDLVSLYTIRQAEAMRQRGDLVAAYDMLQPVLKRRPDDALAQGALARMYAAAGDRDKAVEIYRKLLANDPDNATLQLAFAGISAEMNDWRTAEKAVDRALALAPKDPDVLAGAARLYRARGYTGRAAELYQAAIALQDQRTGLLAQAPAGAVQSNPFAGLPGQRAESARVAQVLGDVLNEDSTQPWQGAAVAQNSAPAYGATASGATLVVPADASSYAATPVYPAAVTPRAADEPPRPAPGYQVAAAPRSLRDELDEVQQERSGEAKAGLFVRSNNGESGLSKLTEVSAPVEVLLPAGDGKVSLRVTPVQLDAGRLGDDYSSNSRFGGGPVAALAQERGLVGSAGKQRDSGVGLSAGYQMRGFSADIGTTPMGFEYTNVVGGLRVNGPLSANTSYNLELSRRAVTDSLVSFAGARDDRIGESWGAVTANGLKGQIGADNNDYGVYAYGGWHKLLGHNVRSNSRAEVGTGIYWNLERQENRLLTAGLNLGAIFYDNNQRYFTYGNGGYFSPQQYYALSVPVTWAQRSGRFTYKLQGSIGLQHFKEDGADYFPTSGLAQQAANTAAGLRNPGSRAVYDGQSHTGLGYSLAAAAEYQLNPRWFLGGTLGMDNATDYRQYAGGLYLRYTFYPMTRPLDLPVNPYQSPYAR
ncbi:cellulose synthase [Bordetella avium]|nr:cellulose synthase [Bordetella avium]RIQ33995.1 cellulose synthase [Bordetella avium]